MIKILKINPKIPLSWGLPQEKEVLGMEETSSYWMSLKLCTNNTFRVIGKDRAEIIVV